MLRVMVPGERGLLRPRRFVAVGWMAMIPICLMAFHASTVEAGNRRTAPPPSRPLVPKVGRTDDMLHAMAQRIQARMHAHISPEGLLVYQHTRGADPATLSHEALGRADAAVWTGCYAASQACRWHATRDPVALAEVRRIARGLALLTNVTDSPGRLVRTVGRQRVGVGIGKKLAPSPVRQGLTFRYDVSRDQLAGVTLGWACILRFVHDPYIQDLGARSITHIADRLRDDDMWMRDHRGKKTEHGELRHDVKVLKMIKNGPLAAIGLAPFVVAQSARPSDTMYRRMRRLVKSGYRDALSNQMTWFGPYLSASNVNMGSLSLLALALHGDQKIAAEARSGLRKLRRRTTGWGHGAVAAASLLGRTGLDTHGTLNELRACLHMLGEQEVPPAHYVRSDTRRVSRLSLRRPTTWMWKSSPTRQILVQPGTPLHATETHTRADWLYAYWLARAAGHLQPSPRALANPVSLPPSQNVLRPPTQLPPARGSHAPSRPSNFGVRRPLPIPPGKLAPYTPPARRFGHRPLEPYEVPSLRHPAYTPPFGTR